MVRKAGRGRHQEHPHGHQRGAPRVRERHFRGASQPNCRRPCTGIQLPIHRRRHSRECTMAEPLRGFLSPVYPAADDNVTHRRVRVHRSPVRFDQSLSAKAAPQAHRARVHGFVRLVPTVSILLQFVDAIGLTLAPINDMSAGFGSLIESGVGGLFVVLAMALVSNFLLIVAALVYGLRWLASSC